MVRRARQIKSVVIAHAYSAQSLAAALGRVVMILERYAVA
jgi:hypothetical protein